MADECFALMQGSGLSLHSLDLGSLQLVLIVPVQAVRIRNTVLNILLGRTTLLLQLKQQTVFLRSLLRLVNALSFVMTEVILSSLSLGCPSVGIVPTLLLLWLSKLDWRAHRGLHG